MMRPQAGVVFLALPPVVALRRRWADLPVLGLAAAAGFVAAGLVDRALVGGFHQSLLEYVRYNLHYSSRYGVSSWPKFVILFLGLSLPPVFLARYRGLDWRIRYQPLLPAVLMFGVFLAAHSAVPHKEERFAIPALPLFLILLTPLAVHLLDTPGQRWRVGLFAAINGAGLILLVSSPLQQNVLGLAKWLDQRPGITTVVLAQDNILLPLAFIGHPVDRRIGLEPSALADASRPDCTTVIVSLAGSEATEQLARSPGYRPVARFTPGPVEALVVWLNPRHNARRGPIILFAPRECVRSEDDE
jgi:hypothetical protein